MIGIMLCDTCKHLKGTKDGWLPVCEAYPNGIPDEFEGSEVLCSGKYRYEDKNESNGK